MNWFGILIPVLNVLLTIGGIWWIIDCNQHNTDTFPVYVYWVCVIFLGWFVIGYCVPCRTVGQNVPFTFAKTQTGVLIEYDGMTLDTQDLYTYQHVQEWKTIRLVKEYNSFGVRILKDIEFPNGD